MEIYGNLIRRSVHKVKSLQLNKRNYYKSKKKKNRFAKCVKKLFIM